jgi:hypothetical protein
MLSKDSPFNIQKAFWKGGREDGKGKKCQEISTKKRAGENTILSSTPG